MRIASVGSSHSSTAGHGGVTTAAASTESPTGGYVAVTQETGKAASMATPTAGASATASPTSGNVVQDLGGTVSPKVDANDPKVTADLGGTPSSTPTQAPELFTNRDGAIAIDYNKDGTPDWTVAADKAHFLQEAREVTTGDTWKTTADSFADALGIKRPPAGLVTGAVKASGGELTKITYAGTNEPVAIADTSDPSGYRLNIPNSGKAILPDQAFQIFFKKLKG